ncbi:MAG: hypothetical protein ACOY4A_05815 [Pseudomonadota bacterium]
MLQSALARRIAFVVVALALTWAGIGRAEAQGYPTCGSNPRTCSQAEAEQASSLASEQKAICYQVYGNDPDLTHASLSSGPTVQNVTENGGEVASFVMCHFSWGGPINGGWMIKNFVAQDCSAKSPLPAGSYTTPDIEICSAGCKFVGVGGLCVGMTVDAQQQWYCSAWEPTGAQCSAGQGDTPPSPSDADGDGSSDGNDTSPNNPGQGGGGNDGKPQEDGGGKGDGNGSGEGSGNGNTSGGGGNCASPPSSSGDAILAQIAYQTWATRCSIESAKDGNGNLKTTQGGSGTGTGGGNGDGDGTDFGTSNPGQDDEFDPSDVKRFGIPVNTSMLDSEAIFGGGTCPVLSVTIYGETFSTSELQGWCDLLGIMRALVLLFGAFTALRILMGNAT